MTRHKYKYLSLVVLCILGLIALALGARPIAAVTAIYIMGGALALFFIEMRDLFSKP
jgi:hypothetical protein